MDFLRPEKDPRDQLTPTGLTRATPPSAGRASAGVGDPDCGAMVVDQTKSADAPDPTAVLRTVLAERAGDALRGKLAIVTGASAGVGRYLALALLDAGARVCVVGKDVAGLRETASLARPDWPIVFLPCDLGSVADVSDVAEFVDRFDRPVDLVIHAGGVHVPGAFAGSSTADLDEQYLVNVRGAYALTEYLLPQLVEAKGHVVFVNSTAALEPVAGHVQYSMTMAALRALAKGLAGELSGSGVRVSTAYLPLDVHHAGAADGADARAEERACRAATGVIAAMCADPHLGVAEFQLYPTDT